MTPDPDRFVKVFDVLDSGFRDWNFAAFGLIFVAIGTIIFVFPKILEAARIPYFPSRSLTLFRYGFLGFALLWTTLAFVTTYASHLHHVRLARDNRCRIAEGRVEHFVPMPPTGHGREAFTVSGVLFSYSDFEVTDAFNNTASRGGPVDADAYVRICYDPAGNAILRLEIRDFTGEKKNYATADGLFPSGADVRHLGDRSSSPLAWDGGYRMFSAVPVNPPPTLFVGVAALVILVGGIMNLRRFRAQMERLVADALSEIKAM